MYNSFSTSNTFAVISIRYYTRYTIHTITNIKSGGKSQFLLKYLKVFKILLKIFQSYFKYRSMEKNPHYDIPKNRRLHRDKRIIIAYTFNNNIR